jgi:hypothetical protein
LKLNEKNSEQSTKNIAEQEQVFKDRKLGKLIYDDDIEDFVLT